jgi:hypothetical protein
MYAFNDGRDLFLCLDARRVETVRARIRIGLQPVDHEIEIGFPPQKRLAAAGEQDAS